MIISGTPRPGIPDGLNLCCVFGHVEVPAAGPTLNPKC